MEKNPENQLQIELKEDVAQGTYCNLAIISHSSSEFILDLIRVLQACPRHKSNHELSSLPSMPRV